MQEELRRQAKMAAESISRYERVKDLGSDPRFIAFVDELRTRAVKKREEVQGLLDGILIDGHEELRSGYSRAQIQFLALETAFWIYRYMRDDAVEGKKILDGIHPGVTDSTQNG